MAESFITVTDTKNGKLVTINLRHVNVIREHETGHGTRIGINNTGAQGFRVLEDYDTVLAMAGALNKEED